MIGRMLEGYPSKPAVVVAIILTIGVMSYYYYDLNRTCIGNDTSRSLLFSLVEKNQSNKIHLVNAIDFKWDNARIIVDYKTEGKSLDCPFGWGWSQEYRQELMSKGMLNMIVFTWKGVVISYLDLDRSMLDFELRETLLTPDKAVFLVRKKEQGKPGYLLFQNESILK